MSVRRHTLKSIQQLRGFKRYHTPENPLPDAPANNVRHAAPHLYDSSPRTIQDLIVPSRIALLELTLSPYLPDFPPPKAPSSSLSLYPGYHFIFFATSASEKDVLEDGYEKHFAPRHPYSRRLWVSGRLEFHGQGLIACQPATCEEKLLSARAEKDKWTTVTTVRKMSTTGLAPWHRVEEQRSLRYLLDAGIKNKPVQVLNKGDVIRNWKDEQLLVDHTFTPTQTLLTRFSFLTFNFHRIHLDKEYTCNVEKWPDLLVHGNLSVVLILETIRKYYESRGIDFRIRNVKYMMLRPVYVDRPVRLTITHATYSRKRAILWDLKEGKAVELMINHCPI